MAKALASSWASSSVVDDGAPTHLMDLDISLNRIWEVDLPSGKKNQSSDHMTVVSTYILTWLPGLRICIDILGRMG